jgi:hypothetical protein
VVYEALDVHRYFTGEQQLLLIELFGHFLLKGLVEKLPEYDDERQYNEESQNERRGSKELFLLERANKALKHEVIYCQKRGKVKGEN